MVWCTSISYPPWPDLLEETVGQNSMKNRKRKCKWDPVGETRASSKSESSARQNAELAYLRKRVEELEQQLRELQQQQPQEEPIDDKRDKPLAPEALERQVWKDIAMNQMGQKHQALKKNEELKSALRDHLKLAKGLDRYIRTHPELLMGSAPRSMGDLCIRHALDDPLCWQRLDAAVLELEKVFEDTGMLQLQGDERNLVLKEGKPFNGDHEAFHMQLLQTRVYPHAMQDVCAQVWYNLEGITWEKDVQARVETLDDRIFLETKQVFAVESTLIMKRFCELEGHPMVWEKVSKTERVSDPTEKFETIEHAWIRHEPYRSVDGGGTLSRQFLQFIPSLSVAQASDSLEMSFNQLRVTEQSPQFALWCSIIFDHYYLKYMQIANQHIEAALRKKKRSGQLTSHWCK